MQTAPRAGRGGGGLQHTDIDGGLFGGLEGGIVLGGDGGRTRTDRVGRDRPLLEGGAGCAGGIGKRIGGTACVRAWVAAACDATIERSDRSVGVRNGTDRAREGRREERKVDNEICAPAMP